MALEHFADVDSVTLFILTDVTGTVTLVRRSLK